MIDEGPLALQPPAIATEAPVAAQHAMARHQHGDAIGGAGRCRGAHGLGCADAGRQFRVADHIALGYLQQESPYTYLKGGAAQVERQSRARSAALYMRFERL